MESAAKFRFEPIASLAAPRSNWRNAWYADMAND